MTAVIILIIGLALGSFVNALVWRIKQQDSNKNKKQKREFSILHGRSMCVDCKHTLTWNDLIPVVSWLALGGKCRYCKKPISWQYPVVEITFALFAFASYLLWPYSLLSVADWANFALWIIALVPMLALVVYDLRWMEMPTKLIYVLHVITPVFIVLRAVQLKDWAVIVSSIVGALVIGGLFWAIYQISDGKWIGGGDVRYGFAMGGLLGWQKAIVGLTLASYLGTALVLVLFILGKYRRKMRIPFGPFLVAATYLSMLFGQRVIDWYLSLAGL